MVSQNASKSCKYFEVRKNRLLILENLENFQQSESKLESNWHWPKMRKNDRFLIKNEFQRPRLGGVFLIAKSVSLLSWRTDFDLWKSFQSRLLRPNGRLRRNYCKILVLFKVNRLEKTQSHFLRAHKSQTHLFSQMKFWHISRFWKTLPKCNQFCQKYQFFSSLNSVQDVSRVPSFV